MNVSIQCFSSVSNVHTLITSTPILRPTFAFHLCVPPLRPTLRPTFASQFCVPLLRSTFESRVSVFRYAVSADKSFPDFIFPSFHARIFYLFKLIGHDILPVTVDNKTERITIYSHDKLWKKFFWSHLTARSSNNNAVAQG